MEFLLFVQPIGDVLLPIVIIVMAVGGLGFIISSLVAASLYYKRTYEDVYNGDVPFSDEVVEQRKFHSHTARSISKRFLAVLLAGFLMLLPVATAASGWEIFKNITIYRVATSNTADKAIENTNLLMDKLNEFIEGWEPKKALEAAEAAKVD